MKLGNWSLLLLIPPGAVLALFLFGLGHLLYNSFQVADGYGLGNYVDFFARKDYVATLIRTIWVSLMVTAFAALVGYPIAYAIASYQGNRNLLMLIVITPWLVSVVVRTYGWIVVLGNRGTMNSFLSWVGLIDRPVRMLFNTTGVVLGLVHVLVPFFIISVLASLLYQDRSLREASGVLGANWFTTFWRITFPLSLPGVVTGVTLVYLLSTGAIVTPLLLGGVRDTMLATNVYLSVLQMFDLPKAATMAVVLVAAAFVIVMPLQMLEWRISARMRGRTGKG